MPSSKKTMDVSKPGDSAPDASSRPVLVTHRPMVQDPMVKDDKKTDLSSGALAKGDDKPEDNDTPAKDDLVSRGSKVIKPVSDQTEPTADEKTATEEETPDPDEPSNDKKEDKASDDSKAEAAVVDAVADQATADKKQQNDESDEGKAKKEALQKLIAEKKYFVQVGQVGKRRNRRALIIFLVLLLILAGAYLAVDAGLIKTSVALPIDLIKN